MGIVRDERGLDEIVDRMITNVARLRSATEMMGRAPLDVRPELEESGYTFTDEEWDDKMAEWMTDSKGNWTISDYGLPQLEKLCQELYLAKTSEDRLLIVDQMLNVIHPRGDLAALFVEGGTATLLELYKGVDLPERRAPLTASAKKQWLTDASGKPLVVYHGSRSPMVEKFDLDRAGTGIVSWADPEAPKAIFFTSSPDNAQFYADSRELPMDINPDAVETYGCEKDGYFYLVTDEQFSEKSENPRAIVNHGPYPTKDEAERAGRSAVLRFNAAQKRGEDMFVRGYYLQMNNPFIGDDSKSPGRWIPIAQKAGHDGVIIRGVVDGCCLSDIYIVFSPDQAKPAPTSSQPRMQVSAQTSGKKLGPGWLYHNIWAKDIPIIEKEGMQAGSFTDHPGFDFGRDAWVAVRKEDLRHPATHQYGDAIAYEPQWEAASWREETQVDPSGANVHSKEQWTVPANRVALVDKQGLLIRMLGSVKTAVVQPEKLGNCVDEDLVDELFGSVTDFARLVEEHGDSFKYQNIIVTYDPKTDIHTFYRSNTRTAQSESAEYRGQHQAPTKGEATAAPLHHLTEVYPDDIYSDKAVQYYGHYGQNHPLDHRAIAVVNQYKNRPNLSIRVYRAVPVAPTNEAQILHYEEQKRYVQKYGKPPGDAERFQPLPGTESWRPSSQYYEWLCAQITKLKSLPPSVSQKYTINPGDWVSINRAYAVEHGESSLNGHYQIISKVVYARDLFTDGNSIQEWGYSPQPVEKTSATQGWLTTAQSNESDAIELLRIYLNEVPGLREEMDRMRSETFEEGWADAIQCVAQARQMLGVLGQPLDEVLERGIDWVEGDQVVSNLIQVLTSL